MPACAASRVSLHQAGQLLSPHQPGSVCEGPAPICTAPSVHPPPPAEGATAAEAPPMSGLAAGATPQAQGPKPAAPEAGRYRRLVDAKAGAPLRRRARRASAGHAGPLRVGCAPAGKQPSMPAHACVGTSPRTAAPLSGKPPQCSPTPRTTGSRRLTHAPVVVAVRLSRTGPVRQPRFVQHTGLWSISPNSNHYPHLSLLLLRGIRSSNKCPPP
mmetsp:Transcript_131345/g.366178  ORF Transcript_131345/g.366178 Transcript_131345/m.366178 type:complete len:214 (-) Transcript_131345:636-1277(-)